ncbi:MAG: hypothetical protein ACQEUT_20850 [Bacillota bacterium]
MAKFKKSFWINFAGILLILLSIGSLLYFTQFGYSSPEILYISLVGQALLCLFFGVLAVSSYKNKNKNEFLVYILTSIVLVFFSLIVFI